MVICSASVARRFVSGRENAENKIPLPPLPPNFNATGRKFMEIAIGLLEPILDAK